MIDVYDNVLEDHVAELIDMEMKKLSWKYDYNSQIGQPNKHWHILAGHDETEIKENELKMREDMKNSAAEMLDACGFKDVEPYDNFYSMGNGIHEMGTARMGKDPKTSVLNKWNQVHAAKNVFITDGSCMTSSSCVNPSITYMALTARAANYAISELKKRNL